MSLPQDLNMRKKVAAAIKESVAFMREVDTLKEDIKNVAEIVVEETGITKSEFSAWVKVAYDASKVQEQIDKLETSLSEIEILTNSGMEVN